MHPDAPISPHGDSDAREWSEQVQALIKETIDSRPTGFAELIVDLHHELRQIAHARRQGSGAGDTLSTTALVNETYIKLCSSSDALSAVKREHFLAIAAQAMRYILINHARDKTAQKRGPDVHHEPLGESDQVSNDVREADRLLELDGALQQLERIRPRLAQVVQLRYFGGLSESEVGEVLDLDPSSVRRDWVKARGWLSQHLTKE